ncbi:hypothetical protein FHR72_003362 [Mycolicibacterium iranicum]|uniref:SnoaL-like domain-containing protein n=1 Tax=Mycolicibacterium iranicum TaxID=912594 RepID=A0A839QF62_MYCIR|nr:hypothetical protein [Mycolicibacterium iranicum]MBB2991872.1 hypothetical protein [Mycolicibacterium iranicum]
MSLREIRDRHTGNAATVLQYAITTKEIVDAAKEPGFGVHSWDPLRELIAVDDFVRVGNFKEVMNWDDYVGFLTNWAPNADWDCTFKRVTEKDGVVFLELEERSSVGEFHSVVNSLSVYAFTREGKVSRIDVYLQMELPSPELLKGYEGVDISQ